MKKIAIIALLILALRMFTKKDENEENKEAMKNAINNEAIVQSLKKVYDTFGQETARNVERIYRYETGHFKSGQFKATGTAGMLKMGKKFPFGWGKELRDFIAKFPQYDGEFTEKTYNTKLGQKTYLGFPTLEGAFMFLSYVMTCRNNNRGSWYSLVKEQQDKYTSDTSRIDPIIVNSFKTPVSKQTGTISEVLKDIKPKLP